MPAPRKQASELTPERLRDLISYNSKTGLMRWRRTRGRMAHAGDEVGTYDRNGYILVGVDGRMYPAHRLAWLHVHGEWPRTRLRFLDGNYDNLAIANLAEEGGGFSMSRSARYQRKWRARRRGIENRIRTNPDLYAAYLRDPEATYARVKADYLDDLARNGLLDD